MLGMYVALAHVMNQKRRAIARRVGVLLLVSWALMGCLNFREYSIGDIQHKERVPIEATRTVGCLDIAFELGGEARSSKEEEAARMVIGNRCTKQLAFDLSKATLSGRTKSGEALSLKFLDPRGEIRLVHLQESIFATEPLAIACPRAFAELAEVCVDVSRIVPTTPEGTPAPTPICFARRASGLWHAMAIAG